MIQTNNNDRRTTILICLFVIVFGVVFKLMPTFYYWQGQSSLKKENYVAARKYLKNAVFLNPHNKDYRYFYVKALTNLAPSYTIQKEMFEIASGNQKDSAQQAAQNRISEWQRTILSTIGDNYIEQVPLDNGILRWDTEKFPLKVAITEDNNVNIPPYYKTEILKAFSQWQYSTGFITFATIENSNNADIVVEISNTPSGTCNGQECKYVVGFTTPSYKGEILHKMKIVLYTKDPHGNFFLIKKCTTRFCTKLGMLLE